MAGYATELPIVDMVGPHVSFISGVFFEMSGAEIIATRYLETRIGGILTREVVSKDAMSFPALANMIMAASMFLAEHPPHHTGRGGMHS